MAKLDGRLAGQCLLIGFVAGMRSMMAPAVVANDIVRRNPTGRLSGPLAYLGTPRAKKITLAASVGETIADKLPFLPARTEAPSLIVRCVSGAVSGAALAGARSASPLLGGALGLAGAVAGTFGGYHARKWVAERVPVPDPVIGAAEDGIALALGIAAIHENTGAGKPTETASAVAPRDTAQPGDILLFSGGTGFNWMIEKFGHTPYFHAAIYAGNDEIIEEQPKGVTLRSLRTNYGSHCIAVVPAPGGRDTGRKALAYAMTQLGDPFDRLDFYVIFLQHIFTHWHIHYHPGNKYTCAEFVAKCWKEVGVTLIPHTELDDIEPADIAMHWLPPGIKPSNWFTGTGPCK